MAYFKEIVPEKFARSPFQMIGKDLMLVAADRDGVANAMTAGWGGLGVMWGKNVAFVVIRPQRYTKQFVDASDTLSLSFFGDGYREMLGYMGSVSGRDEDKIQKAELTLCYDGQTPYFEQAKTVILCKKLYVQALDPACFVEDAAALDTRWYPQKDYHDMYILAVEKILERVTAKD